MNDDDIFARTGGSLLNDILSDLDSATKLQGDDTGDEILASLERELASSYPKLSEGNPSMNAASFGMSTNLTAGAFVVDHQSHQVTQLPPATGSLSSVTPAELGDPDDAWAAALSQFGGMSLAADFLAADSAKKEKQAMKIVNPHEKAGLLGKLTHDVVDKLFENDDYDAEEEVVLGQKNRQDTDIDHATNVTGGLVALLGASRGKTAEAKRQDRIEGHTPQHNRHIDIAKGDVMGNAMSPQNSYPVTEAPPPSPLLPLPAAHLLPSGQFASGEGFGTPHPYMLSEVGSYNAPHMTSDPAPNTRTLMSGSQGFLHRNSKDSPFQGPPQAGPTVSSGKGTMPLQQHPSPHVNRPLPETFLDKKNFPSITSDITNERRHDANVPGSSDTKAAKDYAGPVFIGRPAPPQAPPKAMFNDPNPSAPFIPSSSVASSLMPPRDVCFIVHSMLRPLQTLDAYSDDYYHWSFIDRKTRNFLMLGGMGRPNHKNLPNPVWKEVKVMAKEQEEKYREAVEARAKDWSEEKKILGCLIKTNVKRPKALLTTPVLTKDSTSVSSGDECKEDMNVSEYDFEQQRNRVSLWKARVSIEKGYTAYLSLTELRRLIQANAGAGRVVGDLTSDVKSNVDLLHSSLGVTVCVESDGQRKIEVDTARLCGVLSLSKGQILCARAIEGGILPHQSACEILPAAVHYFFSLPLPISRSNSIPQPISGEDRLLRAFTGLVLTHQPSVEPLILLRCLDISISKEVASVATDNGRRNLLNITGHRPRMELMHAILSRGKMLCTHSLSEKWMEKEKAFLQLLPIESLASTT